MSQWGKKRTFTEGTAVIEAIPHIDTGPAFNPSEVWHRVWMVATGRVSGPENECARLCARVEKQFTNRRYEAWLSEALREEPLSSLRRRGGE